MKRSWSRLLRPSYVRYVAFNLISLMRPQFMLASLLLFGIGAFSVTDLNEVMERGSIAMLAAIAMVQLSAGLINEYTDWSGDRYARTTFFSGGSGVVATGQIGASTALSLAVATLAIAVSLVIYAEKETDGRELLLPLFISTALLAWGYSVRPFRFMERGFGEVLVAVLLAFGVPFISAYYISGSFPSVLLPYSILLFLFGLAAIIGVEFPDKQADIRSRKRNMTYRFGVNMMARVQAILIFSGYGATVVLALTGHIGLVNLLLLLTALFGWAAVTMMALFKYYSYEWARATTTVVMSIFVISMVLMVVDLAVF
ncbi:MAG: prenyltransferase [Methanomassiliicoccales archaeon]|nr:MAG: prenyltransferase [Methanomassiliicoccales archaeon]